MNVNSAYLCDGYKVDHRRQYPKNTVMVYSNWTPRKSRIDGIDKVVVFGIQYFAMRYLIEDFNTNFFSKPVNEIASKFLRRINNYLGPNMIGDQHIRDLHKLGYLPILVKALPEGTLCPIGVPAVTICNTKPEFFWVTNFLETIMSCILWKPMTSATIANEYKKEFMRHAKLTGSPIDAIKWQAHDFSFRGMSGLEDACMSGAGHLLSFTGTDTIPAIDFLEEYYHADSDKELIGGSVAATEHSVMCLGKKESELDTFKRLINEIYPDGIVSIVSDTWDFWKVITEYLPALKEDILKRDGKVVIRPDSGTPEDIICGRRVIKFNEVETQASISNDYSFADHVYVLTSEGKYFTIEINRWEDGSYRYFTFDKQVTEAEAKGAYQMMWELFGGTTTKEGYKMLDSHIGLIYGEAITLDRQKEILSRLEAKGFCASNLVLGIGSFTYTYQTRDTFGFALKTTYGELKNEDGSIEQREIFKDPLTDIASFKKSAKGLLMVVKDENGKLILKDQVTKAEENSDNNLLKPVFKDGKMIKEFSLSEIKETLNSQL